jgi:protein TonB
MKDPGKLSFLRVASVLGIAVAGSLLVFGGLVVMNQFISGPEEQNQDQSVSFSVPPPEPEPQKEPEPRERDRQPQQTNRASLAPAPELGTNLAGMQVSVPNVQVAQIQSGAESLLGDMENVALTENAVDKAPVVQKRPLTYPERAKQRDIEGKVKVSVLVGKDGSVKKMKILEANPPGVFEKAVRNAVPNWRFKPAQYNGRPVETWATVPIPFHLN